LVSLDVERLVKIVRITFGVLLAIAGVALLFPVLASIPQWSHSTAHQLGGLTGSLLMALLAFALAWQCLKKRT
jgi:uncharacterized membrane protein YbhN (UPF0104 family)